MSVTSVNVVPQYSTVQILRPSPGFEARLQGQTPWNFPLVCPGGVDFLAGREGYSPNLMKGAPVAVGSMVKLWLPRFLNGYSQLVPNYSYRLIWRLRTFSEASEDPSRTLNGHLGQRKLGREQEPVPSVGVTRSPRFVIPSAYQTVQFVADQKSYTQGVAKLGTPPNQGLTGGVPGVSWVDVPYSTASFSSILPGTSDQVWVAPPADNFPGGAASRLGYVNIASQGVYSNNVGTTSNNAGFFGGPTHNVVELEAQGDELIIEITRDDVFGAPPVPTPWDFSGPDAGVSLFLGDDNGAGAIPDLGIYLISGK